VNGWEGGGRGDVGGEWRERMKGDGGGKTGWGGDRG